MISELETHEDMLSPWRHKCDSNQCGVLGSLVVMTLAWLVRGRGSTPCWGTEFFQIANGHFDPLLHLVANVGLKPTTFTLSGQVRYLPCWWSWIPPHWITYLVDEAGFPQVRSLTLLMKLDFPRLGYLPCWWSWISHVRPLTLLKLDFPTLDHLPCWWSWISHVRSLTLLMKLDFPTLDHLPCWWSWISPR